MSKPSKKKLEKKKKHEQEDRKTLLKRREKIRAEAKESRKRRRLERDTRPRLPPIRNWTPKPHAKTPEEVAAQIEENYQALKRLEEDYETEVANREGLNESLEAEGFKSLREKMDFLNEEAQKQAKEAIENQKNKFRGRKVKKEEKNETADTK